jgi:serine/threonine-protein kinase
LRSLAPELPEALARVLARALDKRPDARYADGHQMAADLRAVLPQLPGDGAQSQDAQTPAPPDSSDFLATVKMIRDVPGHNSGL